MCAHVPGAWVVAVRAGGRVRAGAVAGRAGGRVRAGAVTGRAGGSARGAQSKLHSRHRTHCSCGPLAPPRAFASPVRALTVARAVRHRPRCIRPCLSRFDLELESVIKSEFAPRAPAPCALPRFDDSSMQRQVLEARAGDALFPPLASTVGCLPGTPVRAILLLLKSRRPQ